MINNEEEIWRAHPDISGIEVSTLGRVRMMDRVVSSEESTKFFKGRILKQNNTGNGYLQLGVKVSLKWVNKSVHRLVAETFLPNPDNLPQVNHKDNDRTNNNVNNLEWCTASYNIQYREKFGEALGQPVFAINLATFEVSRFRSQREASRAIGVHKTSIAAVIKGRRNPAGGYLFVNDDGHAVDVVKSKLHDIGGTGLKIYN